MARHGSRLGQNRLGFGQRGGFGQQAPGGFGQQFGIGQGQPGGVQPLQLGGSLTDRQGATQLFTGGLLNQQLGFAQQAAGALGEGIQFLSRPNVLSGINQFGSEAQRQGALTAQGLGGRLAQSTGNPFLQDAIRNEQANLATGARNLFAGEQLSASAFARRKAMEAQLRFGQASAFGPETLTQLPMLSQQLQFGQPAPPGRPTVAENIFGGLGSFASGGGFR